MLQNISIYLFRFTIYGQITTTMSEKENGLTEYQKFGDKLIECSVAKGNTSKFGGNLKKSRHIIRCSSIVVTYSFFKVLNVGEGVLVTFRNKQFKTKHRLQKYSAVALVAGHTRKSEIIIEKILFVILFTIRKFHFF